MTVTELVTQNTALGVGSHSSNRQENSIRVVALPQTMLLHNIHDELHKRRDGQRDPSRARHDDV